MLTTEGHGGKLLRGRGLSQYIIIKWVSVLYHIVNKHVCEDATIYQLYQHAKLTKRDRLETVWLVEGSPAHVALEGII